MEWQLHVNTVTILHLTVHPQFPGITPRPSQPWTPGGTSWGTESPDLSSYTLALRRTSLLNLLSSLGFSYRLSHLLINCCLPIWWTAADFMEANATFFSLQVCLLECFKSLFGPSYWLLPLLITPSCTQSPFLVNQATANYSERSLMIKGWLPKGLTLISFLNS